ncbi:hypothetical protein [Streptomyces lasiicapitis]|uniref:hypothetical protein n=1 Tax=Streptomyces lasiicapitis TaxID=1923961 RepID=UPI003685BD71
MSHVDPRPHPDALCDASWPADEDPAPVADAVLLARLGRDAFVQVPEGAVVEDVPTGGVL